jgi:hypothetical protein
MIAVHRDPDGSLRRLRHLADVFERVIADWGSDPQYCVDQFCPSNSDNAAFVRWFGRLQRQSASHADIRHQVDRVVLLDAGPFLAEITAPTLVVHTTAWELIDRHRGTIVKSTGDGVLARFDAPSHALEFSLAFRRALAEFGIQIRCGLHTGEVEIVKMETPRSISPRELSKRPTTAPSSYRQPCATCCAAARPTSATGVTTTSKASTSLGTFSPSPSKHPDRRAAIPSY